MVSKLMELGHLKSNRSNALTGHASLGDLRGTAAEAELSSYRKHLLQSIHLQAEIQGTPLHTLQRLSKFENAMSVH